MKRVFDPPLRVWTGGGWVVEVRASYAEHRFPDDVEDHDVLAAGIEIDAEHEAYFRERERRLELEATDAEMFGPARARWWTLTFVGAERIEATWHPQSRTLSAELHGWGTSLVGQVKRALIALGEHPVAPR